MKIINPPKFFLSAYLVLLLYFFILSFEVNAKTVYKRQVRLGVPFATQIPDGVWVKPYSQACEESSIVMIDEYYNGKTGVLGEQETKQKMRPLFEYQNKIYGDNDNSNAYRTSDMIERVAHNFFSTVVENPQLEDIKLELMEGRPVITFHHGYSLQNKNVPFLNTSSSFHTIVLVGYDDGDKQFIVHEPGMSNGNFITYGYDIVMSSMSDYVHETGKTEGPPRALFTSPRKEEFMVSQSRAASYTIQDLIQSNSIWNIFLFFINKNIFFS